MRATLFSSSYLLVLIVGFLLLVVENVEGFVGVELSSTTTTVIRNHHYHYNNGQRQQLLINIMKMSSSSSTTEQQVESSKVIKSSTTTTSHTFSPSRANVGKIILSAMLMASLSLSSSVAWAGGNDTGASSGANAKITTGGASTLQSGRTIAITRGVNLDNADFSNQNLKGVAFQQSIVRDANFKNSNLIGASFFDATVDGSNFENADLTNANFEMAQFRRANLKVSICVCVYVFM